MVKPGDSVIVITQDEKIEGTYLEKPALLKQDTIIVKLSNGYNIGIDKDKIKEIRVVKEYVKPRSKSKEVKQNPKLPKVSILSTGGTISSKVDYTTGGVIADYTAEDFLEMCPEIGDVANLNAKKVMSMMSEDITYDEISQLALEIAKELEKAEGVVVTMGTDTLGYIAAGLSFCLDVQKPVIITAAQKSIDRGSSDSFFNLISSVNVAANFNGAGVYICMHGESSDTYCNLIKGVKVRKMHTSRRDAFRSINEKPVAEVYGEGEIKIINDNFEKRSKDKIKVVNKFEEKVGMVYIHPEIDKDILEKYENYKGIIIMGTGLGHFPKKLQASVKKLIEGGTYVGMTSQCIYGIVSSTVYSPLREMKALGVEFLEILPETALMKLSWLLGNKMDLSLMTSNLKGEINKRIDYESFLL